MPKSIASWRVFLAAFVSTLAISQDVKAAESAAGAYILGLRGPGAGVTPPSGLFFSNQVYIYGGDIEGNVPFDGGKIVASARLDATVTIPTLMWVTPVEVAGGKLGFTLTTPYGRVEVDGRVGPFALTDATTSYADPSVGAFLGWRSGQLNWQLGATGFLPIGDYRRGALANISKNRAALDVYGSATWIEPTWGIDVTNTIGVTFNATNDVTDYNTGTEFHWDWSITKKFENGFSIGPTGYFYRQLEDDSGDGALLGAFRGEAWAIGVATAYDFKLGKVSVTARLRYFHELETENRLEGDSAFVGLSFPLWVQQ